MKSLTLLAPAKLNLYLKVINKRPDGFHNIKTLFERINLTDQLTFHLNKFGKIIIYCHHPDVPTGPKNLVYQAAEMLRRHHHIQKGVTVRIRKRIPVAAGLAGGSTNGAAALLGLNKLWDLRLSRKQLVSYAKRLGSDVAFFLYNTSWALGTGRGDRIKKLFLPTKLWHVLVIPRLKLYAKDIYQALDSTLKEKLTKKSYNVSILTAHLRHNNLNQIGSFLENDLEQPILAVAPQLQILKQKLKCLKVKGVMISGSGPCVFGITDSEAHARSVKRRLSKQYKQVFIAQTL